MNVSKLYWVLGIGWPSLIFLILIWTVTAVSDGFLFVLALIVSILFSILFVYRIYRWSWNPCRRFHSRSMLLFSSLAGMEVADSQKQNRPYDIFIPIHALFHMMVDQKDRDVANELFEELQEYGADIYVSILDKHIRGLRPDISEFDIINLIFDVGKLEVSPYLAITLMIERKYGSLEACKYIVDFLQGEIK